MKSDLSKVFWVTFFKTKTAVSADEFVQALIELYKMANVDIDIEAFKLLVQQLNYVVDIATHTDLIEE